VIESLEKLFQLTANLSSYESLRMKFAWLPGEKDKLALTSASKEKGNSLFRDGCYQLAAAEYALCLTIDAEGPNAGGRLHAILHCNRAACQMALEKYEEAVTDCKLALMIHPYYMKAMLRLSRCYSCLQRFREGIVQYTQWLELAEKARLSPHDPDLSITACLFDLPKDVSNNEFQKVKKELMNVRKEMFKVENKAKSEASHNAHCRREPWYSRSWENKAKSEASHNSSQWYQEPFGRSDTHRRREQWYSSSFRRGWDPFPGRTSNREGHKSGGGQQQQQRSQSERAGFNGHSGSNFHGQQQSAHGSPGSDASLDHYAVLGIAHNATNLEIKRAYHTVCVLIYCCCAHIVTPCSL